VTLRRGFKAAAEKEAERLRREIELEPSDPLDPRKLAQHLGVAIISAEDLVAIERLEELERLQAFAFSAATFDIEDRKIIVTNPIRTAGRLNSDLAHELSHILLKHELSEIREIAGVPFRTCRPDEEEEATTFGGTLLLPRPLLISAARRGSGPNEIADEYMVTVEMARWRYNSTGVAKQVGVSR
jgi:Zn-dependent peptidase ImmA (M78 family)